MKKIQRSWQRKNVLELLGLNKSNVIKFNKVGAISNRLFL